MHVRVSICIYISAILYNSIYILYINVYVYIYIYRRVYATYRLCIYTYICLWSNSPYWREGFWIKYCLAKGAGPFGFRAVMHLVKSEPSEFRDHSPLCHYKSAAACWRVHGKDAGLDEPAVPVWNLCMTLESLFHKLLRCRRCWDYLDPTSMQNDFPKPINQPNSPLLYIRGIHVRSFPSQVVPARCRERPAAEAEAASCRDAELRNHRGPYV